MMSETNAPRRFRIRHLDQILHDDEGRRCCRDCRCRPGRREYSCSRHELAQIVEPSRFARIATMSGPRRHDLAHERVAEIDDRAQ